MILAEVISAISVFGYSAFLSKRYKVSRYVTPIIAISIIALFIYIADMLGSAYFFSFLILIIGLFFAISDGINTKNNSVDSKKIVIPLFLLSLILFCLVANNQVQFSYWDEFSHWGLAAKFFAEDRFLISNNQYLYFRDYPPGIQYVGYFFTFIGGYSESGLVFSANMVTLLAFIPLFSGSSQKLLGLELFLLVLYVCIILVFGQSFDTVLADQQISAISMSLIFLIWVLKDSQYLWLAIAPVGAFISISKQPGFYIYTLLIVPFFIVRLYKTGLYEKKNIKFFLFSFGFVSAFWASWKLFLVAKKISPSVASANPYELLIKFFNCCDQKYQIKIINDFLVKIISFEPMVIYILFGLVVIITILTKKLNRPLGYLEYTSVIVIGYFIYIMQLLLHYMFAFGVAEGSSLASFDRFLMPFIFISFGLFCLALRNLSLQYESHSKKNLYIGMAALILFIPAISGLSKIGSNGIIQRPAIVKKLSEIKAYTFKHSSILLVWENDGKNDTNGLEYWLGRQELAPRRVLENCYSFSPNAHTKRDGDCIWAADTFLLNALSYNYVVFLNGIDEFRKKYPEVRILNDDASYFYVSKSNFNGNLDEIFKNVYLVGIKN